MKFLPCRADDPSAADSGNRLLALLPHAVAERWRPHLQRVELNQGQELSGSGAVPTHVYFPTSAIVSLLYTTKEGQCSEIAVVGLDGLVGISVVMGGDATPSQAVVQSPGQAWRVPAHVVRDDCKACPDLLRVMLSYALAMLAQVARTAACNRYHSIDQLLCRRLLLGLDRSASTSLVMTQESAANLLGVRREGVTGAALKLRHAGAIHYSRGRISVLDRSQLEARTLGPGVHAPPARPARSREPARAA